MTRSPSDDHTAAMIAAFANVLGAEESVRLAKVEQSEAATLLAMKVANAETSLVDAWKAIESLMKETGEFEVVLPGAANDFRIGYGATRVSVKVASADAVPDDFVKTERKPKLKEIGDHLRALKTAGAELPNWATLEPGERKLGWKALKKGAA